MASASEDRLFRAYRKTGDPECLGQVFDLTAPRLLHTALHLTRDPAQAEDLLQATFLTAIQKAESYDPSRPLLPWLTGILTRHAAKARQRASRSPDPTRLRHGNGEDPVVCAEGAELVEVLRKSVQRLPQEYRQVLLLKLLHGLQPAEIAEVLAVPPGTVRMRLHRGMDMLRKLLPVGVVFGFTAGFAPRGLAAIRSAVLEEVPVATVAMATIGGALIWKKILVSSAVAGGLLALWLLLPIPSRGTGVAPIVRPGSDTMTADFGEPVATQEPISSRERSVLAARERGDQEEAETGSVLVTVLLRDEPVESVGVFLTPYDGTDPLLSSRRGATGADGTILFEGVPAGPVELRADRGWSKRFQVLAGSVYEATFDVVGDLAVDVNVVDPMGSPVPHAAIWVKYRNDGMKVGTTDAWGRLRLNGLSRGISRVGATAPGFAPSHTYPVGRETKTSITIPLTRPGSSLRLQVVDSAHVPVAEALVLVGGGENKRVSREETLSSWVSRRYRSDHQGFVHADGLPGEWIQLTVRATGMAPLSQHVLLETGRNDITLELGGGVDLRGQVMGPGGEPIIGAELSLEGYARYEAIETRTGRD